jgi:hypothetical protein
MPYGTSTYQARIAFPSTQPADYAAIGPVVAGDQGANNINHYSDIHAQRRACFIGCALTGVGYYELDSTLGEIWAPLWSTGPFPIPVMPDGATYNVRIQLAGSTSGALDDATFAVVLAPQGSSRSLLTPGSGVITSDAVWVSSATTSSTAAWLTGASQGPNAWTSQVGLTAAEASRFMRSTATYAAPGGVGPVSVSQCLVALQIFAKQKNAASHPRIYGFIADEWVGV